MGDKYLSNDVNKNILEIILYFILKLGRFDYNRSEPLFHVTQTKKSLFSWYNIVCLNLSAKNHLCSNNCIIRKRNSAASSLSNYPAIVMDFCFLGYRPCHEVMYLVDITSSNSIL